MKNLVLLFIVLLFLQFNSFAQYGWFEQNSNISNQAHNLYTAYFIDVDNGWIGGGYDHGDVRDGLIVHTTDGGINWMEQLIPVSAEISSIYLINSSIGWASTGRDGNIGWAYIIKTTDSGVTWNIVKQEGMGGYGEIQFLDENTGWVIASHHIDKSTDGGMTWTSLVSTPDTSYSAICFVDQNLGWFVGGFNDSGFAKCFVAHTEDGGLNWSGQPLNPTYSRGSLNDIQFIDENIGWTVGYKKDAPDSSRPVLYKTTDGGSNWIEKLLPIAVSGVLNAIHFTDANNGWIVGMYGDHSSGGSIILHTTNGGENWVEQDHPETNYLSGVFFIDENNGWATGDSCKILHTTTGGVVSVDEEMNATLNKFDLTQNYPNPFNPSTTISWQSPIGSHQTIKLFDVLGKEVETIVDGYYEAGNHSTLYIVNSSLPSGVYFYQLKAGKFIETKKMILIK